MLPNESAPVVHHFGAGVYMREVRLSPGVVVGRAHKQPHRNVKVASSLVTMVAGSFIRYREIPI